MKRSHIIAIILAALSLQAIADNQEPSYWMKSYPGADQAKVQRCLAVAEEVRDKQLKGGTDGVAWATLHQGNAWEKCMEGK
jgi:hypothetical protein